MTVPWPATVLLGVALAISAPLRADSPAVSRTVTVRVEYKGQAVDGLGPAGFRVQENGRGAELVKAERAGPASVILLVENSRTSWRFLNEVNSAMRGFLAHAPATNDYALVSYGHGALKVDASLTDDPEEIARAFVGRKQSAWRDATLFEALNQTLNSIADVPNRPVIIVVGSGLDQFSPTAYKTILHRIEKTDVVIHAVQLGAAQRFSQTETDADDIDLERGELFLQAVVRRTGGELYCPDCEQGYATAIEEILDTLDRDYRVSYRLDTTPSPGFARLKVQAFRLDDDRRTDFKVRTRDGWRSP